jgi:hypothetical protein
MCTMSTRRPAHCALAALLLAAVSAQTTAPAPPPPTPLVLNAGTFAATLKSGLRIEVLALTEDGDAWWSPDGRPLDGPPTKTAGERGKEQKMTAPHGERIVKVAWKVTAPAGASASVAASIRGTSAASGSRQDKDTWEGVTTARVPDAQDAAPVRIAVAAGPWKTLFTSDGRSVGADNGCTFSPVMERNGHAAVVVAIPADTLPADRKLEATDKNGKTQATNGSTTATSTPPAGKPNTPVHQMILYEFFNLPADAVSTLTFSARPYDQWLELRNVSLKPTPDATKKIETITSDEEK